MLFLYRKSRKNENENKNIINAEAPFHQVGADVFHCRLLAIFNPHKNKKGQRKPYPEKSLVQSLPDGNFFIFSAKKTQVCHNGGS